ncbi:MAG TPA: hypothetical protein DIS94_11045 [Bacteroidetes bacterium]|nr:hypothetical protein [Bacteroidota bacterium]
MRFKKIRGYKKIIDSIKLWKEDYLTYDIKNNLLQNNYFYIKSKIQPWNRLSFTNSEYPVINGKIKIRILEVLLDVYDNWEKQLKDLNEDFYLKIWIAEPRFNETQVVCAIRDRIDYYNNIFHKTEKKINIISGNYGKLKNRIDQFKWESYFDYDIYENEETQELNYKKRGILFIGDKNK